jgi:transcriptional regulator of aromatic amino acid metabolism
MANLLEFFLEVISSFHFLLIVHSISFLLKSALLVAVILHGLRSPKIQRPWFFLLTILIAAIFSDSSWVASMSHKLFFSEANYKPILFLVRLAWGWFVIQYLSLSLFLESLIQKHHIVKPYQKLFIGIAAVFCTIFFYLAFFEFFSANRRPTIEFYILQCSSIFAFIILVPSFYAIIKAIRSNTLPKILKKQLKILIPGLIGPFILSDFLQYYPFSFTPGYIVSNYAVVGISTSLLTIALYFCARKMIGLRFLNFHNHVQSSTTFNFIDDFKDVLEQLGYVSNMKELGHITQAFFKGAFNIQPSRVTLFLRKLQTSKAHEEESPISSIETHVESFINRHETDSCKLAPVLRQSKILITDEITFSAFYDETQITRELVQFLEQINADVFLPIYEKNMIIAYVIIERDARLNDFYSNVERDEMVVFASYLGNIINLLQNSNLHAIIQKDKELREELYRKHQEINQYKESIRSFLHDSKQRKIGILFYKNRQFIFGNQAAKELIKLNLNAHEGHPLSKALHRVVQQVQDYKTGQTSFTKDLDGNRLVLSALPNLEKSNIIIAVYYPEISDILKNQIDLLKDPTQWDYLLYLDTTQSGKLINQLIPGSGEHLLNFKIELLKTALSKKALLIEIPDQDLIAMVELLHHISLRESLHILKLQAPEKNFETAIKLFGMNSIYNMNQGQAILDKLNNTGTLFIQNIHFLDLETQQYLAEFIRYGFYRVFKSDQKVSSNVRIICSTIQNLPMLVQEGKFSRMLFNELNQTTLSMPPLLSLPKEELNELAEGYTEQAVQSQAFKNLLELTEKEKNKLINSCPVSLQEFKTRVQQLLVKKSQKNNIYEETLFDPAYNINDPELVQAARLGKKALKDPKTLAMLMRKFKNQNKVATFLGVNRSSVNRRCKDYNISV